MSGWMDLLQPKEKSMSKMMQILANILSRLNVTSAEQAESY
jgi:hypothetical protein